VVGTWNETAYEPIKDKDGKVIGIWYVGVPATPYDNAVEHFRNAMIIYSFLGILIGFLVAFLIAFTVYRPLRRITDAVEVISEGDFTRKVPVRGKDEPGLLAVMVNTMLEKTDGIDWQNQDPGRRSRHRCVAGGRTYRG